MELKNIDNIYKCLDSLEGDEGKSLEILLKEKKNLLNYDNYLIKPRELVVGDNGSDVPTNFEDELSFANEFIECLARIREFVGEIQKINDVSFDGYPYENDKETPEITPELTLTDKEVVVDKTDVPTKEEVVIGGAIGGITDVIKGDTIQNNNSTTNNGTSNNVSSDDINDNLSNNFNNKNQTGSLYVSDTVGFITDENGNIIGTLDKGEYTVYEVKYDEDGNIIAVRISPDGTSPQWVILEQNGNNVGLFIETGQIGTYTINSSDLKIYDGNGNIIGVLESGEYRVYEVIYDENGNPYSIRISRDGESEQWINICENGVCVGNYIPNPLADSQVVILDNNAGKLSLFNNKSLMVGGIIGVLAIAAGATLYIKNKKGEQVSSLPPGDYDVYDIKQDDYGNVTDAYIANNEEEEYWVHF